MNKFLIVLLIAINAFANSYDMNYLQLQSKVFPKLILVDKNYKSKLIDNKVVITILYETIDLHNAQTLKNLIESQYKTLNEHSLIVELQQYKDIKESKATAYFLLLADEEKILEATKFINLQEKVSFAYDASYLDLGALMSLKIDKKVYPIINYEILRYSNIHFFNLIYQVAVVTNSTYKVARIYE